MQIYLAEQTACFLQSLVLGAALGLLYDAFKIVRIAIPHKKGIVFAEDVFFFLALAVFTFLFMMRTLDGQVRFFLFVGEGLGFFLYAMALSGIVLGLGGRIVAGVRAVLQFFYRWIFRPLWRLLYWISMQILRPVFFLSRFFKKSAQRCKYRLKIRQRVLYNQVRSIMTKKPTANIKRNSGDGKKENQS